MAVDENSAEKMINASMRHWNVTFIARPVGTSSQSGYLVGGFLSDSLPGRRLAAALSLDWDQQLVCQCGRTRGGYG